MIRAKKGHAERVQTHYGYESESTTRRLKLIKPVSDRTFCHVNSAVAKSREKPDFVAKDDQN
jgi:hypothetical protein